MEVICYPVGDGVIWKAMGNPLCKHVSSGESSALISLLIPGMTQPNQEIQKILDNTPRTLTDLTVSALEAPSSISERNFKRPPAGIRRRGRVFFGTRMTGRLPYSMCDVSASRASTLAVSISHRTDGRPRGLGPERQRANAPLAVRFSMIDATALLQTICALTEILSDE
ncbi:uncharacterized [Tachysurus ichikawai]